jgi:hypothetical protein
MNLFSAEIIGLLILAITYSLDGGLTEEVSVKTFPFGHDTA